MTRAQRRSKRMRARQHQKDLRGKTKRVEDVDVPRGPRPTVGYHKSDPPKHGLGLDARGTAVAELKSVGVTDPSDEMVNLYQRTKRKHNGSAILAIAELGKIANAERRSARRLHTKHHEDLMKDASPIAEGIPAQVWEELGASAKRRKKSIKKLAEAAGYVLGNADLDPRKRESWVKS